MGIIHRSTLLQTVLRRLAGDPQLYHLSSQTHRASILAHGIRPGYWASEAGVRHYLGLGLQHDPIVFRVALRRFDPSLLEPDLQGRLDPPLFAPMDQIEDEWFYRSKQSWEDCLRLMGTVHYRGTVAVHKRDILNGMTARTQT